MHRIGYILLFALVFLIFKAFFLDDYLEKRSAENNDTTIVEEVNSSEETVEKVEEKSNEKVEEKSKPQTSMKKNEGMPIDHLGDSIAEKLDKKL